jgi:hypothetical protein
MMERYEKLVESQRKHCNSEPNEAHRAHLMSDSFKFESKATGSFWALGKLSKVWHMSCLVPHDVDFTEMGFTLMLAAPGKLRFSHPQKMMMIKQQSRVYQKLDSNLY